jgi:DNA-binding MarR family transcriptional regulator
LYVKTTTAQPKTLRQPAVLAWLRLARIYQKVDSASAQLFQGHGLNTAQFDVLARVGAQPGMTQQQLAQSLLVTKGNISQLLDRMEQQGLVERRQEGRNKHLYLTAQGQALFELVE